MGRKYANLNIWEGVNDNGRAGAPILIALAKTMYNGKKRNLMGGVLKTSGGQHEEKLF
jgi:hypothetical protein